MSHSGIKNELSGGAGECARELFAARGQLAVAVHGQAQRVRDQSDRTFALGVRSPATSRSEHPAERERLNVTTFVATMPARLSRSNDEQAPCAQTDVQSGAGAVQEQQ